MPLRPHSFVQRGLTESCTHAVGLGYLRFLAPPEKALRWVETRFNLLARLPRYVSVDQKTYGRFGVLPSSGAQSNIELAGGGQRLGP